MMPERAISKIMRLGLTVSLAFMAAGVLLSLGGKYSEDICYGDISALLTDGAGLMYLGSLVVVSTPIFVLLYLSVFYLFHGKKKYSLYCLAITLVLAVVVFSRI
jgi:uncharacterized membrane protein